MEHSGQAIEALLDEQRLFDPPAAFHAAARIRDEQIYADADRDPAAWWKARALEEIEWIDAPLVQGSAFTLICGPKGCGKGTYIAKVAAKMTRGILGAPRKVVFVSSEDSASIDLVPRLTAAGADLDLVEGDDGRAAGIGELEGFAGHARSGRLDEE